MNRFDEIQEIIKALQPDFKLELIGLKDAQNRILQEDVFADGDMPPFNKSAMDGFACHAEDLENELEILETLQAGMVASKLVGKNQCVKIMTGAALPEGCDIVFKKEESEIFGENFVRCTNSATSKNICFKGEDYRNGELLIKKGTIINVSQMAVLAGVGKTIVAVSALPKISLIATGSELVEPEEKPGYGKIRNSNAIQVISQLRKINLDVNYVGLAKDNFDELTELLQKTFEQSDIVIFTGGASVGDFDFIPEVLKKQGFNMLWNSTGIKPGNPMTFSIKGNKYCIGLSGNPVSSLVQFELIVKPVIYKLLGANYKALRYKAPVSFDLKQKKADRLHLQPVVLNEEGLVESIPFHGSAHINALIYANALMEIQVGQTEINKGDLVYVRPI